MCTRQLHMQLQCSSRSSRADYSGHTGFPSVALEIKLQIEHCMGVIHIYVDFNTPLRKLHASI